MGIISTLFIVVFVITAILLVIIVLLQDEQGEGLGGLFGGGSSTPFGSRSGNVLTRFTTILGAVFLFCSFGIAWINRSPQTGDVVGAAKRGQAQQGTAWWLNSAASDAKLPAAEPGAAGTTSDASNGAQPVSPQSSGAQSSSAQPSAPTPPPASAPPAGEAPAPSSGGG